MPTVRTTGTWGYNDEAIYAVRVAAAASRRFGNEIGSIRIPREKRAIVNRKVSSSFDSNSKSYSDAEVKFPVDYSLVDLRELSYNSASISSVGTDPTLHLMDLVEVSEAFTLPSRTFHAEWGGVAKRIDVAGCLLENQKINYAVKDPRGVRITDNFIGQRRTTTENVVSNLFGATSGIGQANEDMEFSVGANASDTVLKATGNDGGSLPNILGDSVLRLPYATNPQPFIVNKGLANQIVVGGTGTLADGTVAGGTDLTSALSGFGIEITNQYSFSRPDRAGTTNYNKSIQPYIQGAFLEERTLTVALVLDPTSDTLSFFEDPQLETLSNEIYIKVQKADDAADWIALMFTSSGTQYNPQEDYEGMFGFVEDTQFDTIGWQPNKLRIAGENAHTVLRAAT